MKRNSLLIVVFTMIMTLSAACQPAAITGKSTSTPTQPIVEPTKSPTDEPIAFPTETPEPLLTPTSSPATGSIKGRLGYPSEGIPALRIVAFLYDTDTYFTTETELNQTNYQLDGLVDGKYHVVAYTLGDSTFPAGMSGGYTQTAACGMQAGCDDHTLVDVGVSSGQVVEGVDLVDWFVPLPPVPQPGQPVQGAITGQLTYPSEFIPPLRIVAFRVGDNQTFFVNTQMNEGFYVLPLPAGTYHVVAYVGGADADATSLAAGYSQAVLCGFSVDCTDHSLIDVIVVPGSVTYAVNPGDYYAPEGTFPPLP